MITDLVSPTGAAIPFKKASVGAVLNESQPSTEESIPQRRAGRPGSETERPHMWHFKISIEKERERERERERAIRSQSIPAVSSG